VHDSPLVSVVIACHQGEAFLPQTLDSVLAQTHSRLEIVAVDDASSDGSGDVLDAYAREHPDRFVVIHRGTNEGPCRARRIGFERASGEFLCWLDQDDLWQAEKVERQLAVMFEQPDVGLVYSYFNAFDSDSGATIPWPDGRRDYEGDVLVPLFADGCFIGSITAMIRRAALATRGVRIRVRDFSFGDDYYLWLAIALDWKVARIPEVLAHYRRHAGNESARLADEHNVHLWRVALLREFLAEFPDAGERLGSARRPAIAQHYGRAALEAVGEGHRVRGLRYGLRGLAFDPLMPIRYVRSVRRLASSADVG
jgi:glycosyltransferase involved in cell wall biosynthesis